MEEIVYKCQTYFISLLSGRTDFPGGQTVKVSAYKAGDPGSIPGSGRSPGGGNGNPLPYSCLENPCRHRSLAGYTP